MQWYFDKQEAKRLIREHRIIAGVILLLVAYGLWAVFGGASGGKQKQTPTPVIQAAPAAKKDVPVYLDGLGTVQAYNTVTVKTQVDGQLIEVDFHEGQDVHKGDVLARIDPRTYKAQLDSAVAAKAKDEATLANANLDLKRYLSVGNTISGQVLDTQRATVRQLDASVKADQAAIDNAQALLSYTVITSPLDGRTGIRQVDQGNIVHASDTNGLVVVTQLEPISVIFSLPQQDLHDINAQLAALTDQQKLPVLAVEADNKTQIDQGVLELVDNQIDQTTGTVKLKSTFPNAKHQLWPGGFVNVRMLLATRQGSVVVPSVAVQHGPQGAYVFVLNDHTVKLRPVTVGLVEDQDAVITDGVQEGEQVVTDGAAKLQDGSKVALPGEQKDKGDTKDDKIKSDKSGDKKDDKEKSGKSDDADKSDAKDAKDDGAEKKHHHKKEGD